MKHIPAFVVTAFAVFIFNLIPANAAVLVGLHDPVVTAPGVTAGPIDDTGSSAGVNFSSGLGLDGTFLLLYDTVTVRPPLGATSEPSAVVTDSYFQFDVAADPGLVLNLSSLDFGGYKGGDSDPRGWVLRSSVDGFAADIASDGIISNPFGGGSTEPDAFSVDLSGGAYQGLADITLRMYAYAPTADFAVNFADVELNGSVVPEPSRAILSLVALGAAAVRRRR